MSPSFRSIRALLALLVLLLAATAFVAPSSQPVAAAESSPTTGLSGVIDGVSFAQEPLPAGDVTTVVITVRNDSPDTWEPLLLLGMIELLGPDGGVVASATAADPVVVEPVPPDGLADFAVYLDVPAGLSGPFTYRATVTQQDTILAQQTAGEPVLVAADQTPVRPPRQDVIPTAPGVTAAGGQNVDLVFAMDPSGSMYDEFDALCDTINDVVGQLQAQGINLNYRILSIGWSYQCATDMITDVVPGGLVDHEEDWAPATSDLANSYPWTPGYVRLVVPVSDEGPEDGDWCQDPGSDRDAVTVAIADASRANVRVSPIIGTGYEMECILPLAQALADGTGGRLFMSTNPGQDIAAGLIEIIGGAVNRSYITAAPASVPVNGSSTVTVTIRDSNNQLAAGRRVRLSSSRGTLDTFTPTVGLTNAQGQFVSALTTGSSGVSIISARDLTVNEPVIGTAKVTFGTVTNPPAAAPRIVDVKGDSVLEGLYAQGLGALPNKLQVTVDWQGGAPGSVDFILNNTVLAHKSATGPSVNHTVDFGALRVGTNTLRIVARNSIGEVSKAFIMSGWQVPPWLTDAISTNAPLTSDSLSGLAPGGAFVRDDYVEVSIKVPGSPLFKGYDANFLLSGHRSTVTIQVGGTIRLPLRGGQWYADFTGSLGRNSDAPGRPQKILQNIKFVGRYIDNIEGSILLGGVVDENGLRRTDFGLGYDITFEELVLFRVTLLEMLNAFPPGGTSVYVTLKRIPPVEKAVGRIAQATVGLTPHFTGQFDFLSENKVDLAGTFGINGDLDLTVSIANGMAEVYGGVGIGVQAMADSTTEYCFTAVGNGHVGYRVDVILWEQSGEYQVELVRKSWGQCPPGVAVVESEWVATQLVAEPWHIPRGNFAPDYTQFVGALPAGTPDFRALNGPEAVAAALSDAVLFSNVYGNAKPSLAWAPDGSRGLIVWTYDDPAKPAGQGLEIVSSYYNGASWGPMTRVTTDNYPDSGARVTRTNDGKFIAVWERLNDPALPPDAPFDATSWSKMEVMAAIYDPSTGIWSAPVKVHADNSVLDYSTQVAAGATGAIAAWRHNPNAQADLVGTDEYPEELRFARWNGSGWSAGTIAGGLVAVDGTSLAARDVGATLAWTQTITPTGVITGSMQVFASTFDGANWAAPLQLTSGATNHASAQAFYTPDGQPAVAWVQDGSVAWQTLGNATVHVSNLVQDTHEFRLATNAAGNLVATWSEHDDVMLSLYDWNDDLWGAPVNLTNDIDQEAYLTPFLENSGQLRIGYANTHMTEEERTATTDTGEVVTYTIKIPGATDLNLLSLSPFSDLTADSISVTPDSGGGSADVAVTVRNSGYFAASNVRVHVYDGDPGAGGALVDNVVLPAPLAAGITQTITVTHTIDPNGGARTFWAVVDPAGTIVEADETNNRLSQRALGPDLVIDSALVRYATGTMVDLEATVRNDGLAASAPSTVTYYRDDIGGTTVATVALPALAPGESATVLAPWDFGPLAAGDYQVVAVANEAETDFAELELVNNTYDLTLQVSADLVVDPLYFTAEPGAGGAAIMRATIFNFGSVAAHNVPVVFYQTGATLTEVATTTITNLPAGGSAVASATWNNPPAQYEATVIVDPEGAVADATRDNNAATLTPGFQVHGAATDVTVNAGETATFNVDVRSVGGFATAVSLEALDLPPGATATINPTSVAPPAAATVEITVALETPGAIYPVRVVGRGGSLSSTTIVNVEVIQTGHFETEPNNSTASANLIAYGETVRGKIGNSSDYDMFKFTAAAGDQIVVTVAAESAGSSLDAYVELLDAGGNYLADAWNESANGDTILTYSIETAGDYYLIMWDYWGGGGANYFYALSLDRQTTQSATTLRVSIDQYGGEGYGRSGTPAISDNGRFVAFDSYSYDLLPDGNPYRGVYIRDTQANSLELISVSSAGEWGQGSSWYPSISDDGRYVTFVSYANNLTPNDTNGEKDVFVHDRNTGQTTLVSRGLGGNPANSWSDWANVSPDGRYVVFSSLADNLVSGDTNGSEDVFIFDRQTAQTTRLSLGVGGAQANDASYWPVVSANGAYVAFISWADNLVAGDSNGLPDVFVRDRATNTTAIVSVHSDGTYSNSYSFDPTISNDGRYVAFESYADNLVDDDINGWHEVFVHDRQMGQTERAAVDPSGAESDGHSTQPDLSPDGRYVAFLSSAVNLVGDDFNGVNDVFVYDRQTGTTQRISVSPSGGEANDDSGAPAIAANATAIAFDSYATDMTPFDTNESGDVFVRYTALSAVHTIAGNVLDEYGDPLEGVRVVDSSGVAALSDVDGNYLIEGLLRGDHVVTPFMEEYEFEPPHSSSRSLPPDASGIDFQSHYNGVRWHWFGVSDDAYVDQGHKTTNYGSAAFLRVKNAGADMNAYLKFHVVDIEPEPGMCHKVGPVWLQTWVKEPSTDGGAVYQVGNGWSESALTWNNAPTFNGAPLGSFGAVNDEEVGWAYLGSGVVPASGIYSYAIHNNSSNSVDYSSQDGETQPQLVVGIYEELIKQPRADFWSDQWTGLAPLTVQFNESTTGCPTAWHWDFGDGATSSLRNPSHTYTAVGDYEVTLTVTNSEGSDTVSYRPIRVVGSPNVVFMSVAKKATVGGLLVEPADIVRYDKTVNGWTMVYDGSAHGTTKNVGGFAFDGDDLLLTFSASQTIPGLGMATPYDIVRFTPDTPGVYPLGAGVFSWYWQGKANGLSKGGEKLDAIDENWEDILLSTSGATELPLSPVLKAADEDVLNWLGWDYRWNNQLWLDGSTVTGLVTEDINGLWYDDDTGDAYVTILGAFNLGGVTGDGKSIVRLTYDNGWQPSLVQWLAPGATFPSTIDAIELAR